MLFDLIDKILFSKKQIDTQAGDDVVHPYILNRWISMYSPSLATVINNTGNWLYSVFETDSLKYFKFLQTFIPRVQHKRVYYIKKSKKEKAEADPRIDILANTLELSKREIKFLLEHERQYRPTHTD